MFPAHHLAASAVALIVRIIWAECAQKKAEFTARTADALRTDLVELRRVRVALWYRPGVARAFAKWIVELRIEAAHSAPQMFSVIHAANLSIKAVSAPVASSIMRSMADRGGKY